MKTLKLETVKVRDGEQQEVLRHDLISSAPGFLVGAIQSVCSLVCYLAWFSLFLGGGSQYYHVLDDCTAM